MANIPVVIRIGEQTWQAGWVDQSGEDIESRMSCQLCEQNLTEEAWIITEPGHSTGFMCGACATYVFAGQPGRSNQDRWKHV
ncbi:hypothetical protein [Nocardia phage P3.1]|nr:hypothetical protein [Nocardia phage P3.1]